jgi:hypothetical protein
MLVCVVASGERSCGADLLDVGFETCFEREPRGSETHYYACAHVFESRDCERASGDCRLVSYRQIGSEAFASSGLQQCSSHANLASQPVIYRSGLPVRASNMAQYLIPCTDVPTAVPVPVPVAAGYVAIMETPTADTAAAAWSRVVDRLLACLSACLPLYPPGTYIQ